MEKFFEETNSGIVLNAHVIPGSGRSCFEGLDPWRGALKIKVREKAEKGNANKEALKLLNEFFNKNVELVAGGKSRDKKFFVKGNKSEILHCLTSLGKQKLL
jgi:hypothetical protein